MYNYEMNCSSKVPVQKVQEYSVTTLYYRPFKYSSKQDLEIQASNQVLKLHLYPVLELKTCLKTPIKDSNITEITRIQ